MLSVAACTISPTLSTKTRLISHTLRVNRCLELVRQYLAQLVKSSPVLPCHAATLLLLFLFTLPAMVSTISFPLIHPTFLSVSLLHRMTWSLSHFWMIYNESELYGMVSQSRCPGTDNILSQRQYHNSMPTGRTGLWPWIQACRGRACDVARHTALIYVVQTISPSKHCRLLCAGVSVFSRFVSKYHAAHTNDKMASILRQSVVKYYARLSLVRWCFQLLLLSSSGVLPPGVMWRSTVVA